MIKTYKHYVTNIENRDDIVNQFTRGKKLFGIYTNLEAQLIITTIIYEK